MWYWVYAIGILAVAGALVLLFSNVILMVWTNHIEWRLNMGSPKCLICKRSWWKHKKIGFCINCPDGFFRVT